MLWSESLLFADSSDRVTRPSLDSESGGVLVSAHPTTLVMTVALTQTDCPSLKLVARGKVRDIYEVPGHPDALLFVATDRVSAFDVTMQNVGPPLHRNWKSFSLTLDTHAGHPQQGQAVDAALALLLRVPRERAGDEAHPEPCHHEQPGRDADRGAPVPGPAPRALNLGQARASPARRGDCAGVHHRCVLGLG